MERQAEGEEAAAASAGPVAPKGARTRPPKHPGRRSVGWALVRAARLHRARLGDGLAALGLFPGQETVLQALADRDSLTVGELAELLEVRPPTASKAVSRLRALGLVERREGAGDGAARARVALTEAGRERAGAAERVARAVERDLLADLDGGERKRLRKLLRRTARALAAGGEDRGAEDRGAEDRGEEADA